MFIWNMFTQCYLIYHMVKVYVHHSYICTIWSVFWADEINGIELYCCVVLGKKNTDTGGFVLFIWQWKIEMWNNLWNEINCSTLWCTLWFVSIELIYEVVNSCIFAFKKVMSEHNLYKLKGVCYFIIVIYICAESNNFRRPVCSKCQYYPTNSLICFLLISDGQRFNSQRHYFLTW